MAWVINIKIEHITHMRMQIINTVNISCWHERRTQLLKKELSAAMQAYWTIDTRHTNTLTAVMVMDMSAYDSSYNGKWSHGRMVLCACPTAGWILVKSDTNIVPLEANLPRTS
jgi:hypothetical protein